VTREKEDRHMFARKGRTSVVKRKKSGIRIRTVTRDGIPAIDIVCASL